MTVADAKIGYLNLADDAELTASSQILLAPITRLQDPHVGVKWRATGGAEYFVADLGAMTAIDCVRVMGLTAATIRIRYSTSDPADGDLHDTGVLSVDQRFLTHTDIRSLSPRYVRVDLTGTAVEAGRLFIGELESFEHNVLYGWSRKWVDPSDRRKTEGGQTRINERERYRMFSVEFGFLNETEMRGFVDDIDRINGMTSDLLLVVDPGLVTDVEQDSIWGLMTDISQVTQPLFDRWSRQYSIEQRL